MRFDCFGTRCGVWADAGARDARRRLQAWHNEFSRFLPRSELSRLTADPRSRAFQFTLVRAGDLHVVRRPPGLAFDSGGLAKGLFADLIADRLRGSFAVDCGGDLRFAGEPRRIEVADPFGGPVLHVFEVTDGAVATSGIGRRSWIGPDGRPAHHLLDPSTGRPAFTGVVQATALAPTAVEAEWRAKAAVLSADGAWLAHGGVLVLDDGRHEVVGRRADVDAQERAVPIS